MSAESHLYISLIVHEKPDVILNQLRNFRYFAPEATIVLHISGSMAIPGGFLEEIAALGQIHVNPARVTTTFHTLYGPHHENLRYILGLSPMETDRVALHASNDMLVRKGVEAFCRSHDAAYYHDGIYDPPPDAEVFEDREFNELRARAGAKVMISSQVEGTFYQVRDLRRAFELIEEVRVDWSRPRLYFAEEVVLPTLIHAALAGTAAKVAIPYILSEVSFIAKYREISGKIFGNSILAKVLFRLFRLFGPGRISRKLVDGLRRGRIGFYEAFSTVRGSTRFRTRDCYGVKRVAREIDDPLRRYISQLK